MKILDPALRLGAFPSARCTGWSICCKSSTPNNEGWKRDRLADAQRYCEMLRATDAKKEELAECDGRIEDIRHSFDTRFHALDFARKLYLVENCIYGVDIQPIACQIAKLRFFIALIVDQHIDREAENLGVRPLPNLETKIVAAHALMPIDKPAGQRNLLDAELRPLLRDLERVRHEHFDARTPAKKAKCRARDEELRAQIAEVIEAGGHADRKRARAGRLGPLRPEPCMPGFSTRNGCSACRWGKSAAKTRGAATLMGRFAFVNQAGGKRSFSTTAKSTADSTSSWAIRPMCGRRRSRTRRRPSGRTTRTLSPARPTCTSTFMTAPYSFSGRAESSPIFRRTSFASAFGEKLRGHLATGTRIRGAIDFAEAKVFTAITEPCIYIARREDPEGTA